MIDHSDDDDRVVQFPGARSGQGATFLAALIILVNGGVQIARIAAFTGVMLLAAIGALSLLGR